MTAPPPRETRGPWRELEGSARGTRDASVVVEATLRGPAVSAVDLPQRAAARALPAGVEIECEAPRFDYASLPPGEQARRAGDATRAFLARYCAARDKPMWE
jgi:hypothetical protein